MPAFSDAISSSESPRYSTWSRATLVTAVASGAMTLVESSRPPSPTSTTARSTPASAKQRNASAVVASKKVAPVRSMAGRSRASASASSAASTGRPPMRMRSVNETRCGEVYRPIVRPGCAARRADSQSALTEPLPLVPADVERTKAPVRMVHTGEKFFRSLQPPANAARGAGEQPGAGIVKVHS